MQQAIDTIQEYAKKFKELEQSDQKLFEYLNSIPDSEIDSLIKGSDFDISGTKLHPVNLLRYDVLKLLKAGENVSIETIDSIKTKIIDKDEKYFSKYGDKLITALKNYPIKKKSPFVNWKNNYHLLFPFIYTKAIKEGTEKSLDKIFKGVEEVLKLEDYKNRIVNFYGSQMYGVTSCWIAWFPWFSKDKPSHQKAYQLFLQIDSKGIEAGIKSGSGIDDKSSDTVEKFKSIDEVIEKFKDSIETVVNKNKAIWENPVPQRFWWLNANPKIWRITDYKVGDVQSYTSFNESRHKRRIYKYFNEVKPGDLVVGYESTPVKQIKAIYEITEGLHYDAKEEEIINFELKEIVENPISWDELKEIKGLKNCEVFKNNQGSLYSLKPEEFKIINDLIEKGDKGEEGGTDVKDGIIPYNIFEDSEKPFLDKQEVDGIINSLKFKKNIVLQGPPGVGKTFIAKKIAYEMMGKTDDSKIRMIQFHQSYAYEDFIQGIRPSGDTFKIKNGIFYNFCKKAELEPDQNFFFIIDEINRGNLSKIFGELMMLIEADKRGKKYAVPLTYSEENDELFSIPENLYLIGTMNTADRSLAIVDYALRRRFRFISLRPEFDKQFRDFLILKGISKEFVGEISSNLESLNKNIELDKNLGAGFMIGHSFFCHPDHEDEKKWFNDILNYEIKPLLEEYWFDDKEKADKEINSILK